MLKDNGGRHFILTHRLTESTWGLLKEHRLAHLIEEVVGIDQDFPRKPDPASLNYLIDTFHLERTDTMMIGDRRLDIEAGKMQESLLVFTTSIIFWVRSRQIMW